MAEHPAMKLKERKSKWAGKASADIQRRGTEGSLTRIAESHGESPLEFARSHTHSPDKAIREKSLFAANLHKGK
jgi:hypothetical protein